MHRYTQTDPGGSESRAVCTAVVLMVRAGDFNTTSFQQYGSTSNTPAGNTSRNLSPSLSAPSADDDGIGARPGGNDGSINRQTDEHRPSVGNFLVLLTFCASNQLESDEKQIVISTDSVLSHTR